MKKDNSNKRSFGDLEQAILNLMKNRERMTVKDVLQQLGSKDKYTTIMTVMSRLAEKGMLGKEKVGLRHEYWLQRNAETTPTLLGKLKSRLFGIKTVEAVSYLINEGNDLTLEDLEKIQKMIEKASERNTQ